MILWSDTGFTVEILVLKRQMHCRREIGNWKRFSFYTQLYVSNSQSKRLTKELLKPVRKLDSPIRAENLNTRVEWTFLYISSNVPGWISIASGQTNMPIGTVAAPSALCIVWSWRHSYRSIEIRSDKCLHFVQIAKSISHQEHHDLQTTHVQQSPISCLQ